MMKMKVIEFVCTANHGRSPIAEAIAIDYITGSRLHEYEYRAASSGINVKNIRAGVTRMDAVKRILEMGKQRMIINPAEIDRALRDGNTALLMEFYRMISKTFAREEEQWRDEAFYYFDIRTQLKETPEQIRALDDRIAVFGMEERHKRFVEDLYEKSDFEAPRIEVLDTGLENPYGKTKELYFENTARMTEIIPEKIDEIAGEELLR